MEKVDDVYRTRTPGIEAQGIPDQYADGKLQMYGKNILVTSSKEQDTTKKNC